MNYLDLFHGIGGFAYGAYLAGMKFENHYCSDIEPYTQELYKLRFPDSIQLGDITKIDTAELPKGDWIITGGFPCQDISIAGKGAGIHGERSGLWFEYWRIIRDLRPRFAIMENVGMLVHRGLREVLGSLAEIGYNAEWQDIRASDVGAPHRRERIWIVAYTSKQGLEREKSKGKSREYNGLLTECDNELSITSRQRKIKRGDRGLSDTSEVKRLRTDNRGRKKVNECWEWWTVEPAVGELVDGLPSGLGRFEGRLTTKSHKRVDQLKGLGNAIVPQIAQILFEQIKQNL